MNNHSESQQQLYAALRFLSLTHDEKLLFLKAVPHVADYRDNEGATFTLRSAELCLRSCAIIIDRHTWLTKGNLHQLLVELYCVVEMALELGESVIDYHYVIDKSESPVSGPFDSVWSVFTRLANEALRVDDGFSHTDASLDMRILLESTGLELIKN